jgi:AraC family transcriptional regulator of adaptative response/methylated-DNA-[protein]-cysteine methyltransferase
MTQEKSNSEGLIMHQNPKQYARIAKSIGYIKAHFKEQPSLNQLAENANLSPFHFQRMFTDWAGVSPKQFMQFISLEYAKNLLAEQQLNLLDTAYETGLSGTSRLHDLFIKIEGMTPAEYKNAGINLLINYSVKATPFGNILIASTAKGVCHIQFFDCQGEAEKALMSSFPKALFKQQIDSLQQAVLMFFDRDWFEAVVPGKQVKLHLKGSAFQLKVWQALLKIPLGDISTYGSIAKVIGNPKASRAVGTAIGANPIAFIIPCHRVIQASGVIGGYRWGETRKSAILGWEGAKLSVANTRQG